VPSGVYCIRRRSGGAVYVGCSSSIQVRWERHLAALRRGAHENPLLQAAFNEDGPDGFSFEVLEEVADARGYADAERRWIETLGAAGNLFNLRPPSDRWSRARAAAAPKVQAPRRLSLETRMTRAELDLVERAARNSGLSVEVFVRSRVLLEATQLGFRDGE